MIIGDDLVLGEVNQGWGVAMAATAVVGLVVVVGLVGERGREVKEFIEDNLGEDGLARSVVVAAPADTSPLMRLQGAAYATTVAEYFRDQGKQVLLIMATNYGLKVLWEVVMTPFTYLIVGWLKKAEGEDYFDRDTDFTPFSLKT